MVILQYKKATYLTTQEKSLPETMFIYSVYILISKLSLIRIAIFSNQQPHKTYTLRIHAFPPNKSRLS